MARRLDEVKRSVWCERLAKFKGSNLTVAAFCRVEGVSQTSFYYWSKRIGRDGKVSLRRLPRKSVASDRNEPSIDFVEVVVSDSICVRLPMAKLDAVAALVGQLQSLSLGAAVHGSTGRFQRIALNASASSS